MRPLKWSRCAITFNSADQLKCAATAGALPMLCSPVISNVQVTKTLINGGAGLNVSDVGFRQTLKVRTLGCTRSLSLLPIYALAR